MTHAEHVRWCKKRAHAEYDYYMKQGKPGEAKRNAVTSMLSDLGKHEETRGFVGTAFLISQTVVDEKSLFRFIDGFTE